MNKKIIYSWGMNLVNYDRVSSVYVSRHPHACMCGCSGNYFYFSKNAEASSKGRGYEVTSDEINDAKVKRVINKMIKNAHLGIEVLDDYIFTVIIGQTQYTMYLLEKGR